MGYWGKAVESMVLVWHSLIEKQTEKYNLFPTTTLPHIGQKMNGMSVISGMKVWRNGPGQ